MTLTVLDVNPNNVRVDLGENDYNYGRITCQGCNLCGPADYFLTPKTNTYQKALTKRLNDPFEVIGTETGTTRPIHTRKNDSTTNTYQN